MKYLLGLFLIFHGIENNKIFVNASSIQSVEQSSFSKITSNIPFFNDVKRGHTLCTLIQLSQYSFCVIESLDTVINTIQKTRR